MKKEQHITIKTITRDSKDRLHSFKGNPSHEFIINNKVILREYHKHGILFRNKKCAKIEVNNEILSQMIFKWKGFELAINFSSHGGIINSSFVNNNYSKYYRFEDGKMCFQRISYKDVNNKEVSFITEAYDDFKYFTVYNSFAEEYSKVEWLLIKYDTELKFKEKKPFVIKKHKIVIS